jgi:glycosyltransferase involved in cell wall biosynthesis
VSDRRSGAQWRDLIVLVSGSRWDGVQFASHHVARELAQYAPVLYVDPPQSPHHRLRRDGVRALLRSPVRVVAPSLAVVSPRLPRSAPRAVAPVVRQLIAREITHAVRVLGGNAHAVILFSTGNRLFGLCGEAVDVYYAKDDFSAATDLIGGTAQDARAAEEWCAQHADLVVAHSPVLMERWEAYEPLFVPNGVCPDDFAATDTVEPPADVHLSRPVVGFVGHLSNRIDLTLLEAVAARGRSLLLVGPRQPSFAVERIEALLARPNVQWVGEQPYRALPSYLRCVDVAVVPYTGSAFNRASFPLKTLEYLAAGRPVVATDLPAITWLATDLVRIATEPDAFVDAVDAAIGEGLGPEAVQRRRAFAAQHSWAARVRTLAAALGLTATSSVAATGDGAAADA